MTDRQAKEMSTSRLQTRQEESTISWFDSWTFQPITVDVRDLSDDRLIGVVNYVLQMNRAYQACRAELVRRKVLHD